MLARDQQRGYVQKNTTVIAAVIHAVNSVLLAIIEQF
jgi:hypothetical protein